ncbi:MAG: iron ABC transporter permease [Caldilineaceae bacterium]|nr:iron ABC transporter permease [Caldilineaceae bacterium]
MRMQTCQSTPALPMARPLAVRRFDLLLIGCGLALLLLLIIHIVVGAVELTPWQVFKALLGRAEELLHTQVVVGLRLPRALVAMVAGGMIGLSGALLQSITRNPLAEPGLLGVSAGGVLAVVLCIIFRSGSDAALLDSGLLLPGAALLGGLGSGILVYTLSWHNGADPVRLVLTGVLVGGLCSALTSVLLLWSDEYQMMRVVRWTIGSMAGRVWVHWHTLWPVALVAIPLGLLCASLANTLQLGDGLATGLGVRLERTRAALLLASVLLDAGSVAVVGPISFVGLIGPHMARRLVGGDARRLFPLSVLLSAMLLIAADILARTITIGWMGALMGLAVPDSVGVPVGAVTALLGAPFFLYLLLRRPTD